MSLLLSIFGAEKIPLSSLKDVAEYAKDNLPNIIIWAVPFMVLFSVIEIIVSYYQKKQYYEKDETIGSVFVGLGNLVVNFLMKTLLMFPIIWIYNMVPWRMEFTWWALLPCYIAYDFASYWAHRVSHENRFWWATHVTHHSSEKYNLTVSFRLSWVQNLKIIFFLPVMIFGWHPVIFFITNQLAVLFQFWVHTEYIKKLPRWVEYIFATPSNHRVHHGSQEQYIDKNYAATFIIWDRIFGTYEEEHEKVKYGITTNIENKANPFYINFHEYGDIWQDIRSTKSWKKKLWYLFGSPVAIAEEKKAKMALASGDIPLDKNSKPKQEEELID